jgi:hypothetical protein
MMDLPSLFDSRGVFQELPPDALSTLSEAHAIAYSKIKTCAADLKAADQRVADAIEGVKAANDAVIEMQNTIRVKFPKLTFHQLWKDTFKAQ